jgi:hypothetical protein
MEEVKEATEGSKTSEVLSPAANIETAKLKGASSDSEKKENG